MNKLTLSFVIALSASAVFSETLYNGIELPKEWPPKINLKNLRSKLRT